MDTMTAHAEYCRRPPDERFESMEALITHAAAERRASKEVVYAVQDLHFAPNHANSDLVLQSPKGSASLTHWSFAQAARSLSAPGSYLRTLPPALAADCLNYGISQAGAVDWNLLVKNGTDRQPIVRACTSEKYGRVWDEVLYDGWRHVTQSDPRWVLPPVWPGQPPGGLYAGDRDSFGILINGGSIVTDPSSRSSIGTDSLGNGGGALYRGIMLRNSEVGACAIAIDTMLFRAICGNHTIFSGMMDTRFKRRHVGQNAGRDAIRELARIGAEYIRRSPAQDEQLIRLLIDHEIAHTKDAVIEELKALGYSVADATAAYETCERTETASPRSYWGLAQATTRISQQSGFQNERFDLDRLAAAVLARGRKLVHAA